MDIRSALDKIDDMAEAAIAEMRETSPEALGLDPRSCYRVWASEDAIAIPVSQRRSMDYYGGFEYVDTDYVHVLGDYVFYMADDDRVSGHLSNLFVMDEEGME